MFLLFTKTSSDTATFDWGNIVPGNTSKTLWTEWYPVDSLPWVINPECGYVYNINNTPFDATCNESDLPPIFPEDMGFRTGNTNRSMRFMELMLEYPFVNFEDMKITITDESKEIMDCVCTYEGNTYGLIEGKRTYLHLDDYQVPFKSRHQIITH